MISSTSPSPLQHRDVREGHLVLRVGEHARLRLAEAHGLAAAGLELPHEEEEHQDQEAIGMSVMIVLDQNGDWSSFSK